MTVTAHKLGGPVGVGALVIARELEPTPLLHGGGQERDLRSGTVSVAADRRVRGGRRRHVSPPGRDRRPASRRCAAGWSRASAGVVPDAIVNGDPEPGPSTGCPTSPT